MSHEHHDHNPHQHNGPVSSSTHNLPPPPHGEDQPPVQASHAMAMEMYFHFGYENFVLFKQWSAVTDTTLFLTCLFYFVLAILYEVLKAYRRVVALRFQFHLQQHQHHHHHHHHHRRPQQQLPHPSDPNGAAPSGTQRGPGTSAEPCETPIAIGERLSIADSCSVSEHGGGGNGHQKLIRSTMETMIGSSNNASGDGDDQQNGRSSTVYVVAENSKSKSKSKSKSNNEIDNLNGDSIATFVGFAAPYRSYGVCEHPPPENQDSTESSEIPLFSSIADMFSLSHLASTMLYMLQVLFAYLLMLAFMLFNVPICGAILAGAAVGHFVLAQKAIALQDSANEDYCH